MLRKMTYCHFSVAFSAITKRLEDSHGLRRVTYVSRAFACPAFSAREPHLPRQPLDAVARGAAPGAGDRVGAAGTRPALGPADASGRALRRARARDAGALAAAAAGPARAPRQAFGQHCDLRVGHRLPELSPRAAR